MTTSPNVEDVVHQIADALLEDEIEYRRLSDPEDPIIASLQAWRERGIGRNDLGSLAHWASKNRCTELENDLASLLELTEGEPASWTYVRGLADRLARDGGLEQPLLTLLRWIQDAAPDGGVLAEPPYVSRPAADKSSGRIRVGLIELHPNLAPVVNDYQWYWANYLRAAVAIDDIDDAIVSKMQGLKVMTALLGGADRNEANDLRISVAMVEGAALAKRNSAKQAEPWMRILEEIENFRLETGQRHVRMSRVLTGAAKSLDRRLSNLQKGLETLTDSFVEETHRIAAQVDELEQTSRDWLNSDIENVRDDLVSRWKETHTVRQREDAEYHSVTLVGSTAWKRLEPDSRQDLLLIRALREGEARHQSSATVEALLLCVMLERELGAALIRDGVAHNEMPNTLERKADQAMESKNERLQGVATGLRQQKLHSISNRVRHGGRAAETQLKTLRDALYSHPEGRNGLLAKLVLAGDGTA